MLYGDWNQWQATKGHDAFTELAQLLGQDHQGPQRSVLMSAINVEELWSAALRCAVNINDDSTSGPELVQGQTPGAGLAEGCT